MKISSLLLILALPLVGCNTLRKVFPQYEKDQPAPNNSVPADYTIKGVTASDFDFIPVRVLNSIVTVKVNRLNSPEKGWHDCDTFEVLHSTKGTGGGGVRLWYLNLTVGGVSFPVAPKGTEYEIHSVLIDTKSSHELY